MERAIRGLQMVMQGLKCLGRVMLVSSNAYSLARLVTEYLARPTMVGFHRQVKSGYYGSMRIGSFLVVLSHCLGSGGEGSVPVDPAHTGIFGERGLI